jgi:hypothetical protein
MQALLEAAQLEIGCCGNPLHECYNTLGILAMETWIKAVWEQLSCYQFKLFLKYQSAVPPTGWRQGPPQIFPGKGHAGEESP